MCEPRLCHNKGGGDKKGWEDGKGKGGEYTLCAFASLPSLYLGWMATNMCVCNGQQSLEISCDKYAWCKIPEDVLAAKRT